MSDKRIIAAGAVVTRDNNGVTEYLLIYRGYRDDWTFPKGKVDPGEHIISAAIREVREETGFAVQLGIPLPTATYLKNNLQKDVFYWHAKLLAGTFAKNEEVNEIKWQNFEKTRKLLSYEHDVEILEAAAQAIETSPLIVLRHTQAIKRAEWAVDKDSLAEFDARRPLTAVGRIQANGLVPALAAFGIQLLHTSDSRRCRDTLGPYSSARSIPITLEDTLSEERHLENPKKALNRVAQILKSELPLAICTHRPVLPTIMEALSNSVELVNPAKRSFDPALTPGSMVIYHRDIRDLTKVLSVERHIH